MPNVMGFHALSWDAVLNSVEPPTVRGILELGLSGIMMSPFLALAL